MSLAWQVSSTTCTPEVGSKQLCLIPNTKLSGTGHRIDRILALDPTDICFWRTNGLQVFNDSLSVMSAVKVVAIHSNGDLFGSYKRIGHVNTYINEADTLSGCLFRLNGLQNLGEACMYTQTACVSNVERSAARTILIMLTSPFAVVTFIFFCSHNRPTSMVVQNYNTEKETEDQEPSCYPLAYRCHSYGDFVAGQCTDCNGCDCAIAAAEHQYEQHNVVEQFITRVDTVYTTFEDDNDTHLVDQFYSQSFGDNYYTIMSETEPWCQYLYLVELEMGSAPSSLEIIITMFGQDRDGNEVQFNMPLHVGDSNRNILHHPPYYGVQRFSRAIVTAGKVSILEYLNPYLDAIYNFLKYCLISQLLSLLICVPSRLNVKFMGHTNTTIINRYSSIMCADYLNNLTTYAEEKNHPSLFLDPKTMISQPPIVKVHFSERSCHGDRPLVNITFKSWQHPHGS